MLLVSIAPSGWAADLADELSKLTGYIVFSTECIDEFERCVYGKIIQFQSQAFIKCNDYGYQYAYYVKAVIMVYTLLGENDHFMCKMVVGDYIYDIDCSDYMRSNVAALKSMREKGDHSAQQYATKMLRILGIPEK